MRRGLKLVIMAGVSVVALAWLGMVAISCIPEQASADSAPVTKPLLRNPMNIYIEN